MSWKPPLRQAAGTLAASLDNTCGRLQLKGVHISMHNVRMQPFLREVYIPKEVVHLSESESRSETVELMNELKRNRMNETGNDF